MIEGKELGERVLKLVTEHPEQHDNGTWVHESTEPVDLCGTTACLAGWAVVLNAQEDESPIAAVHRIARETGVHADWEGVGVRLLSGRPIERDPEHNVSCYDDQQDLIRDAFYAGDNDLAVVLLARALDITLDTDA